MHSARRVKYGTIAGIWTVFALCVAGQNYAVLALAGKPVSWLQAFSVTAVYSYLWAIATPVILWLSRRFPLERRSWVPNSLLHIGLAAVFGIIIKLTFELIVFALHDELRGPLTSSRLMRSSASSSNCSQRRASSDPSS